MNGVCSFIAVSQAVLGKKTRPSSSVFAEPRSLSGKLLLQQRSIGGVSRMCGDALEGHSGPQGGGDSYTVS